MSDRVQELMNGWDGIGVVQVRDAPTDAWVFVALHDDTLGNPVGGTRIKIYDRPEDGLLDAQRLAEGMTYKWASIEQRFGGGKAVIALSRPVVGDERVALMERYGRIVEMLDGKFATGQDLGTSPEDMLCIGRTCSRVHGYDPVTKRMIDPGPYTARGVFAGLRAALDQVFGTESVTGRRVLIQGTGGVGQPLARMLAAAGADLLIADIDAERAVALAAEIAGTTVAADAVYDTECDVYAPCAVGQTLSVETIPRLACRIVAGSANNQLGEPADCDRLHGRGILYAPDYVINAGGAAAFGLKFQGETDESVLNRRVDNLGQTLRSIFVEAAANDESPAHAARRRVERVLAQS